MAGPSGPDGGGYFGDTSGGPPPVAGGSSFFRVNQDNVLQAHQRVQRAVDQLNDRIRAIAPNMRLEQMGGDPVSRDAVVAFNYRMTDGPDSYLNRARQYQRNLQAGADQLRASALSYGYTEEDIARGFPAGPTSA